MAKTFTSLIKCTDCGYNYRFIKERGINKYLCSGYAKRKGCTERNILQEDLLLDIVQIFCNRNKLELVEDNIFMKSIIDKIEINCNHNITVYYKNGEKGIFHRGKVHI